jgi:hypothetical protein
MYLIHDKVAVAGTYQRAYGHIIIKTDHVRDEISSVKARAHRDESEETHGGAESDEEVGLCCVIHERLHWWKSR